ncbi:sensor domain-containing diguanylate cyclase [Pseudomonas sp. LS44]|uniref:sensor domain-containing diguanylate cyclase n=1 Tax=Pseudomonas sp. LS44 TaxID=1357074 RepID=UPI00215A58C1|nr:sensor domain-containing diguanylate cyclase [Pseudomonas sp. LS44]UVE18740.1 sensor domain-containing diguanylate cyclase [Pseudomonas sp. LS44]
MLQRSLKHSRLTLLVLLFILLVCGFLATSLASYYASHDAIRNSIIYTELPLTSDTVYSEIQKDLIRPVLISSMMSRDTFVRDWVIGGEKDVGQLTRYLLEVQEHYGAFTSFFISEKTRTYYQAKGVLKQVSEDEPRDAWYFRVRDMQTPYEINFDPDMANQDRLTFFINYQVLDYSGNFIGATGVGLTVDEVVKLIDQYQLKYERSVYFVDTNGKLMLTGAQGGPFGARAGQMLQDIDGLNDLMDKLPKPQSGSFEYREHDNGHYLNVRYIPELDWYLFVDKHDRSALAGIRQSLYLNLLICLLITAVVLTLVGLMLRRHQRHIEALATTDVLTDLPNRRGFNLLAAQALQESQRERSPLSALMIDIDHFKALNDTHGHLAGDQVLKGFASELRDSLRKSDILCRWGGEEFVVLLKGTDSQAAYALAEKLRMQTTTSRYPFAGKELRIEISIGVAEQRADDSLHNLLMRADHAMYRAKQSGRNQVCVEPKGI